MYLRLSSRMLILAKIFIWLAYLIFCIDITDSVTNRPVIYELMISGVIIQLTVISFLDNWSNRGRPLLLDWFRLTTFLVIMLNYFSLMKEFDNKIKWSYGGIYINQNLIIPSLITILVGLIGIKIGEMILLLFNITRRKKFELPIAEEYEIKNIYLLYIFAILIPVFQIFLIITGVIGYGNDSGASVSGASFILLIISNLSIFILTVLSTYKYILNKSYKYLNSVLYISFGMQVLYGLLSGMKEFTIQPVIIILIPYLLSGRALPKKVIIPGLFALMVLYPLNNNFRTILGTFNNVDRKTAFLMAVNETFSSHFLDNLKEGSDAYSDRLSMYPSFVSAIELEPKWDYFKHMDRFAYLPVSFLPRFLVPSKPISDTGGVLNIMLGGADMINSQTATTYGWAYLEGGDLYVFLQFLILGFFISFFNFNLQKIDFLFAQVVFNFILVSFLKVETEIYFLLSLYLQNFIVFYICYKIFIKRIRFVKNLDTHE